MGDSGKERERVGIVEKKGEREWGIVGKKGREWGIVGKKGREWGIVFSPSQVILDEHEDCVDRVPEVIEQLRVVLGPS